MAKKKKSKVFNKNMPEVPESQQVDVANLYKPMSGDEIFDLWNRMMAGQQEWAPAERQNQVELQQALFRSMAGLQREQAPAFAETAWNLMNQYMPNFRATYEQLGSHLRDQLLAGPSPEFTKAYTGLGARIAQGLAQGYNLGPDLAGEIEQGIRAGQTARGNYLGPALTAEEAFGKGQAALNLYNQRIGAAQNYLQGRNLTDIRSQITGQLQNFLQGNNPANLMGQMAGTFMGQSYYPNYQQLNPSIGVQAAQVLNTGTQDYNRNYISAFDVNNKYQYESYDRNFEQYLYNQAVQHGLYSMPGGMGGGMGGMGGLIGGIGSGIGGLLGGIGGMAGGAAGAAGGIGGAVAGIGAGLAAF
jgi:hypothetical protein